MARAPGSAMHWLTTTTATLNSSAILTNWARWAPSFCCRSLSSPLPENSARKSAMMESMMVVWKDEHSAAMRDGA